MKVRPVTYTGTTDPHPRSYESEHADTARRAAEEGIVLLKNEGGILPLKKGSRLALFGAGASHTAKGGTGSGDVNERHSVSVLEGLKAAGFDITTEEWIREYEQLYEKSREAWREKVWEKAEGVDDEGSGLFAAYATTVYRMPCGPKPVKTDTDTAVYVLSRICGEGADRSRDGGDYLLSDSELEMLGEICSMYEKVILLVNTGGLVDLAFLDKFSNISGVLYIVQPGQEGGHAVAAVLAGNVTPSGKLTDSWPLSYDDIPYADEFSHNNGDLEKAYYKEGIYVGYRYFDTFQIPVRYPFGYGLSYTDFRTDVTSITASGFGTDNPEIILSAHVENTGTAFSGKEVVQAYVSCPQEGMRKEYRRLAGFCKTRLLKPGEGETVEIHIPLYGLASYDERVPGWILQEGVYGIFAGNSLAESKLAGSIKLESTVTMVATQHVCQPAGELEELADRDGLADSRRREWLPKTGNLPSVTVQEGDIVCRTVVYGESGKRIVEDVRSFVENLSTDQLVKLATGELADVMENGGNLGAAGMTVPGSAAQTSGCALEQGVASIVLADGPAGLRLKKTYTVRDGAVVPESFLAALEGGYLLKDKEEPEGEKWYQYCTAFPVGILLAQTWNPGLVAEVGRAAAEEMDLFETTLWLAPGMNIHRNPLCGRNFEYYSEDPLLSGRMAAAVTDGVQGVHGCGATIKHFACNNQEDNRTGMDSVVSERALREIYLKGFEIAVAMAGPYAIMTSYNKLNGIHTANSHDLCTKVARDEWGFSGVIMTDWNITYDEADCCTAAGCMRAGNDLVMPGHKQDHDSIKQALEDGSLSMDELRTCIAHVVECVWKSNRYECIAPRENGNE